MNAGELSGEVQLLFSCKPNLAMVSATWLPSLRMHVGNVAIFHKSHLTLYVIHQMKARM